MKIGLKLILIISAVNLAGIGGLTIAAALFSSSRITELSIEMSASAVNYYPRRFVGGKRFLVRSRGN